MAGQTARRGSNAPHLSTSHHSSRSYASRLDAPISEPAQVVEHRHTSPIVIQSRHHGLEDYDSEQSYPSSYVDDLRSSQSTYASTLTLDEETERDAGPPRYPPTRQPLFHSETVPSNPVEFADLFGTRRLRIRHDDATPDGNMNLLLTTHISKKYGSPRDVILFHLRMQDLHHRQYSLRRYCRESGREVCHSKRKIKVKPTGRPGIQRSLTSTMNALGLKSDAAEEMGHPLKRHDSGYHSIGDAHAGPLRPSTEIPSSTTTLEYSNYAHVDVRKCGIGRSKHFDFHFWGKKYSWKRHLSKLQGREHVWFDLYDSSKPEPIAHIATDSMTKMEAYEEQRKGGWVPPSSMWISDESIFDGLTDVGDVIVATGLIALVDFSIKREFHSKK